MTASGRRLFNGFIVGGVIMALGLGLGGSAVAAGFGDFFLEVDEVHRGTQTVALERGGTHSIYAVDDLPDGASQETCGARQDETFVPVRFAPLRPFQTVDGVAYWGWWDFDAPQAGPITLTCVEDMRYVVGGPAPGFGSLLSGIAGIFVIIAGVVVGGITMAVTAIIRATSRKRQVDHPPPGAGTPYGPPRLGAPPPAPPTPPWAQQAPRPGYGPPPS